MLHGTLTTFPLVDLLQWMGTSRKTGTLSVHGARHTKRVYLKEGRIVSSASDDPAERLGQIFLTLGRASEEDLRRALEIQREHRVLLGKALLMAGVVGRSELESLLVLKAEETILSLLLWEDGRFEFAEGDLPEGMIAPADLDPQRVLLKDLTIMDELRHIRDELGSPGSVLVRTRKDLPEPLANDQRIESVLSRMDGSRCIAEIGVSLRYTEFTLWRLLHKLYTAGYVALARKVSHEAESMEKGPSRPVNRSFWSFGGSGADGARLR